MRHRNSRTLRWIACLVLLITSAHEPNVEAQSRQASRSIRLTGKSTGGFLTLMRAPALNYPYVVISNQPGVTAAQALGRLALELANCSACEEWYGRKPVFEIKEDELIIGGSSAWIFGGTDAGFNLPAPPDAVSVAYDTTNGQTTIEWINPPGGYDTIVLSKNSRVLRSLPGNTTHYAHQRDESDAGFPSTDMAVAVVGVKEGVPSNGAAVRLSNHTRQESLMNVPFTGGVAPGFQRWNDPAASDPVTFGQGNLKGMEPAKNVNAFNGKGFYQILRGRGTFDGGVSRRFSALRSGHTYRVSARINTFNMREGKWKLSLYATHNAAGSPALTAAQMAGKDAVPGGATGAKPIARYDATAHTGGEWVMRSSQAGEGEITLPDAGADSITVWFRLEGTGESETEVGFDSLMIEDLGKLTRAK